MTIPPNRFIAFTGRAQSGKTTSAKFLESRGYQRISFADPLKDMLRVLTPVVDKHRRPGVLCGKSVREALQTLGTEWGRKLIGEDIWARHMIARIDLLIGDFHDGAIKGIVIDDCRFDNEAELLSGAGATLIKVCRESEEVMDHESERGVSDRLIHYVIPNNGLETDLERSVLSIVGLA